MVSTSPVLASDDSEPRTVTVSASGSVEAEPDGASIVTGVSTQAASAREAMSGNSKTVRALIDELLELGIKRKHIQTSSLNINPRYEKRKDRGEAQVVGYVVTNDVTIKTLDLKNLGAVLDRIITVGANRMHGLSFLVSNADTLRDEARTKAIMNARRRAELYASAAGVGVGKVLHILEGAVHSPSPRRVQMSRMASAESVPIESGTQSLSARVTVTWALVD